MSKNKHYTSVEKKIFLEILKEFKHVIEVKKSDSSTLYNKEIAWSEICKRYNECTMIAQERTVQQLKKLWANLKQTQRDILTKEKQACLATGGGPPLPETNIFPDIAIIAPHIMQTAPVLFTSNMEENKINEKAEHIISISLDDNEATTMLCESHNDDSNNNIMDEVEKDEITIEETMDKENQNINKVLFVKRKKILKQDTTCTQASKITKIEKNKENLVRNEDLIKIERIKRIMENEKEIADIRKAHEKELAVMKENFYEELHILEIRTAIAKVELAELQLQKEKEK